MVAPWPGKFTVTNIGFQSPKDQTKQAIGNWREWVDSGYELG